MGVAEKLRNLFTSTLDDDLGGHTRRRGTESNLRSGNCVSLGRARGPAGLVRIVRCSLLGAADSGAELARDIFKLSLECNVEGKG